MLLVRFLHLTVPAVTENRGDAAVRKFEFIVKIFSSKAKLADGSVRQIERGTVVRWDVEFGEIDPQELQKLEEQAVKNVIRKLGRVFFGV